MGSVGDQNPWAPYNTYKDCSQSICSIYCPQFCYFIFPPPPLDSSSSSAAAATPFSPLVIAVIGILASAFLLVGYYTIVTRFCNNRPNQSHIQPDEIVAHDQFHAASNGLDDAVIKKIAVCRYEKGDGLIEGTECSVCLCEFRENDSLRLLPKCSHAFHLPCIDTWLRSHANCPLCRSSVVAFGSSPVREMEAQRPSELILVVDEIECRAEDRVNLGLGDDDGPAPKSPIGGPVRDLEGVKQFRRSVSLGAIDDLQDRLRNCAAMKRSFSTGFVVTQ